MDFFKNLLGMNGGKRRSRRRRVAKRGGGECESGEACAAQFSADSSLSQGEAFAKMTAAYHGGRRSRKQKQRGGAADLTNAFDVSPPEMQKEAGTAVLDQAIAELSKFAPQQGGARRQRGGSADLAAAFQAPSAEMNKEAGTSVLDQAFAQLSKFVPNHNGGGTRRRRRTNRRYGGSLGSSPIDAPDMLLRPEDYKDAFLSPQWTQENMVNPNFNAPPSPYMVATTGGRRRSYRKGKKAHRKTAQRKSRKSKSHKSRKNRKSQRK